MSRETAGDFLSRAVISTLFLLLSINLCADFVRTGRVTGLLLLVSESLIVVLTVLRRRATAVDRSTMAALVTTVSVAGPPLLRAGGTPALASDALTATISAIGLLIVVASKITLGRSFGLAPANRGVVARGPYTFVRHPIYAGYLITHVAFLIANPTTVNAAVVIVSDAALIVRALFEERILGA